MHLCKAWLKSLIEGTSHLLGMLLNRIWLRYWLKFRTQMVMAGKVRFPRPSSPFWKVIELEMGWEKNFLKAWNPQKKKTIQQIKLQVILPTCNKNLRVGKVEDIFHKASVLNWKKYQTFFWNCNLVINLENCCFCQVVISLSQFSNWKIFRNPKVTILDNRIWTKRYTLRNSHPTSLLTWIIFVAITNASVRKTIANVKRRLTTPAFFHLSSIHLSSPCHRDRLASPPPSQRPHFT